MAKSLLLLALFGFLLFSSTSYAHPAANPNTDTNAAAAAAADANTNTVAEEEEVDSPENELYERLKLGDRETWDRFGPQMVDLVEEMMESGLAKSPIHALLILFWPDASKEEHEQTLARIEPLVRDSYQDFFDALLGAKTTHEPEGREQQQQQTTISAGNFEKRKTNGGGGEGGNSDFRFVVPSMMNRSQKRGIAK